MEKLADGTQLKRHPDDLKRFTKVVDENEGVTPHYSEKDVVRQFIQKFSQLTDDMEDTFEALQYSTPPTAQPSNSNNTRVTRSQGQQLTWNPQMNTREVLLPTAANNNAE